MCMPVNAAHVCMIATVYLWYVLKAKSLACKPCVVDRLESAWRKEA